MAKAPQQAVVAAALRSGARSATRKIRKGILRNNASGLPRAAEIIRTSVMVPSAAAPPIGATSVAAHQPKSVAKPTSSGSVRVKKAAL